MELRRYFLNLPDANLWRQKGVGSSLNRIGVHSAARLDVCDLALRMDSCVGASRAGNLDFMIEEFSESALQRSLNGSQSRLDLPSVKFRAVIREGQLEVAHRFRL